MGGRRTDDDDTHENLERAFWRESVGAVALSGFRSRNPGITTVACHSPLCVVARAPRATTRAGWPWPGELRWRSKPLERRRSAAAARGLVLSPGAGIESPVSRQTLPSGGQRRGRTTLRRSSHLCFRRCCRLAMSTPSATALRRQRWSLRRHRASGSQRACWRLCRPSAPRDLPRDRESLLHLRRARRAALVLQR